MADLANFTRRDIEAAYRKAGLSARGAKVLTNHGFRAYLRSEGREHEIPEWEERLGIEPERTPVEKKISSSDNVIDLLSRARDL